MKKILLSLIIVFVAAGLSAQAPQSFKYQTVVRDATGAIKANQSVSFRISILADVTPVYVEKFVAVATNNYGLVTLEIGKGTLVSGSFTTIDWQNDGPFSLKTEIDMAGTETFTEVGTSELLSVPFALHAKTVENTDDEDADPTNELQSLSVDGYNLSISGKNSVSIPSVWEITPEGINYTGKRVLINSNGGGDIQLELTDVFNAGGKNLLIGDDSYLSDIDQLNTLGIYGNDNPTIGAIRLGSGGPLLSGKEGRLGIGTYNPEQLLHLRETTTDPNIRVDAPDGNGFNIGYNQAGGYMALSVKSGGTDYWDLITLKSGNVGIGTASPDASAELDISSTTKGFLPPRMTLAQRDALTPVEGLMVYNTDTKKPNYYDGAEWKNYDGTSAQLKIGDSYQGGIVAYILQPLDPGYIEDETHGLIAAPNDQSGYVDWGCEGTLIPGADGTAIGTGNQNTIDIVDPTYGCPTAGIAARLCSDLELNGYDDWYLPSKDELNILFTNKAAIGGFTDTAYWSSSEYSSTGAWYQYLSNGSQWGVDNSKNGNCYTRAVRSF